MHQHDIVYCVKCPGSQFWGGSNGETARRLSGRVLDHNGRDAKSDLVKHAIEKYLKYAKIEDLKKLVKVREITRLNGILLSLFW